MAQSVDFNFHIWIDEISHQNILNYNISYKFLICAKPLSIRFNKVNRFIRDYDQAKYLISFGDDKYDATYNRIRYLRGVKSGIACFFLQLWKNQN